MTILLLRHGETLLNASRVMQPADTPLGPRGRAQATAAAARLASLRPAAILSSDLPRAWQTAEAVAAVTGLAIEPSALLHERNFGALRGRPRDRLGFDPIGLIDAPEGGESLAVFLERAAAAWALIARRRAGLDGPLLVVSHGLLIHAWLQHHATLPAGTALPGRLGNTGLSVVGAAPPHVASLVDCTAHLPANLADRTAQASGA